MTPGHATEGGAYWIRGGTVVDATGERAADVLVRDGRIAEVVAAGTGATTADRPEGAPPIPTLDATGCVVMPGLVDVHAHLRVPGMEEAETVESGARAAALGGYTAIVAMPNTTPPVDDVGVARLVLELGRGAPCDVHTSAAITVGRRGEELAPLGELHALGVRIFTDDGDCLADARVMRRALEYASALPGAVLAQHAEEPRLVAGGHMHEGAWSSKLGIAGRPAEAEAVVVLRDALLTRLTGGRLHVQHLSARVAVDAVRWAKAEGVAVTAEATPHHFTLTDACVASFDPVFKVNPPLRSDDDVAAIREALADGTIDCIATDHAPHTPEAKEQPFDQAPSGMLGLQTALALAHTELVLGGHLTLAQVVRLMTAAPAGIAGLEEHGGPIEAGRPANLCVFDPAATWVVDPADLASRARNTPYAGRELTGRVRHTVLFGEAVVIDGKAQR
jgi:dihydroorotase